MPKFRMKHCMAASALGLGGICSLALAQVEAPTAAASEANAVQQAPQAVPLPQAAPAQFVQVRVLSVTPVTVGSSGSPETTYKVIYEHDGRQYSVQLPQNPGEYLTLQMPPASPAAASADPASGSVVPGATVVPVQPLYMAPVMAYPYVVYVGGLYRPFPHFGGVRHFSGGRMGGRRGGRH